MVDQKIQMGIYLSADGLQSGTNKSVASLAKLDQSFKKMEARTSGAFVKPRRDIQLFNAELKTMSATAESTVVSTGSLARKLHMYGGAMAGIYAGIKTLGGVSDSADQFKMVSMRIKNATESVQEYEQSYRRVLELSKETGASLESVTSLYVGIKRSAKDTGASNAEVLQLTESLNKLGVISGASSTSMSNAMLQLSQSMAGGVVRAEEFNSIIENTPEIAAAMAKGMGMTVGQLRLAVNEGSVLAKDVMGSILSQTDSINERFSKMPILVEKSNKHFKTSMSEFVANLDSAVSKTYSFTSLWAMSVEGWALMLDKFNDKLSTTDWTLRRLNEIPEGQVLNKTAWKERTEQVKAYQQELQALIAAKRQNSAVDVFNEKEADLRSKIGRLTSQSAPVVTRRQQAQGPLLDLKSEYVDRKVTDEMDRQLSIAIKTEQSLARQAEIKQHFAAENTDIGLMQSELDQQSYQTSKSAQLEIDKRLKEERDLMRQDEMSAEQDMRDWSLEKLQAYYQKKAAMDRASTEGIMQGFMTVGNFASNSLGQLMEMQNKSSKAGFENYKKMAIAQAMIDTATGAMAAYKAMVGIPYVGPFIAPAAAAMVVGIGAMRVSQIQQQQFQPTQVVVGQAHDGIDNVPTSGTWNLQKGERIVGASLNADLTDFLRSDKGGMKVEVHNYGAQVETREQNGVMQIIINQAAKAADAYIANGIVKGTSATGQAIQRSYGANR